MRIHFIAIGGTIMHNLAITLHLKGNVVTGSDDEIYEPAKSRLKKYNLLPNYKGYNADVINNSIELIIVGMHASDNNPELIRALELNVPVLSYPAFMYTQTADKTRIVVAGSHGKTTITSMIMHVLKSEGMKFDYLVGSELDGFNTMVDFSKENLIAIFEGDEYPSSPIDKRPKFHVYQPHIGIINGISWDHANVFRDFQTYIDQFKKFILCIQPNGYLIYNKTDKYVNEIVESSKNKIIKIPYEFHNHIYENGKCFLLNDDKKIPLQIFGSHNMQNISAALKTCEILKISKENFYKHISNYKGAKKRIQLVANSKNKNLFIDFAHSPSKLKATIKALKEFYPEYKLVSVFELHTFSSLSENFLPEYKDSMNESDISAVFYLPENQIKKFSKSFTSDFIKDCFNNPNIKILTSKDQLIKYLLEQNKNEKINFLMMSSGTFDKLNFNDLAEKLKLSLIK